MQLPKNNISADSAPQFFSVAEVAVIMNVSPRVVRQWLQEQKLPFFRLGSNSRLVRISRKNLEIFIKQNTHAFLPGEDI